MRTPKQAVEEFIRSDPRQSALLLIPNSFADPLDAPGRSFLGGLPFLPPDMEWPTIEEDGEAAGLIFAGQINLNDLPDFETRGALPKTGVLYFFYKDNWETEGGEEGIMPCVVLFSERPSEDQRPRAQPQRMVPMNVAMGSMPVYLDKADYRNHGHFRFDLEFVPFRSAPEEFDVSLAPLGALSDQEAHELAQLLGTHPSTRDLGAAYVEFAGLENAWKYACEDEALDLLQRLQRDSLVKAVASRARPERTHVSLYNPAKFTPELIFCWGLISSFARGLLYPLPDYAAKREEGSENAWVRAEASRWLQLTADLPPLEKPSDASAEAFLEFLREISECRQSNRISYDLGVRFSSLCREIFHYAVNLASEARELWRVPDELQAGLDFGPTVDRHADGVNVYVTMHQMLGHGSYDHTAVQPNQRADKVLLLRLDCADPMLRSTDGSYHFWIDPEKLAVGDFSEVELTC